MNSALYRTSSTTKIRYSIISPVILSVVSLQHFCSFYIHQAMSGQIKTQSILDNARIAPEIFKLRPDYRALLVQAEGIPPGTSDAASEAMLREAEEHVKSLTLTQSVIELPHIAAWREAYKAFGAKPQRTRNSLEALTLRVDKGGLPRVNRLTDIYNAISVKHQIPFGGEDLDKYNGAPFLIRATGKEEFHTTANGQPSIELAAPGEPIWCDSTGITCRRWNWRQGPRTALTDETTRVLFILDALKPLSDEELVESAEELCSALKALSPAVKTSYRVLSSPAQARLASLIQKGIHNVCIVHYPTLFVVLSVAHLYWSKPRTRSVT
jgi:DNA/RNA-binding domain of Phe-tRNA-synthetase-like protein